MVIFAKSSAGRCRRPVLLDQYFRRGETLGSLLLDRGCRDWAGFGAFLAGLLVFIGLFANQALYGVGHAESYRADYGR
ncbi:hypothetical protein [Amycolatopsis sp. H20-H5]|uniref:hypothetical protein n=1 Tax=Amycolatopsis sp. H20-H5 TaxID=3046309 RepID=UPI002DB57C88|nr:hypothetical protein [Amycolatopsis sp. H20-H5]MEC3976121.1 hypothetical protein [Amycolatopsis sp. H20-H5]